MVSEDLEHRPLRVSQCDRFVDILEKWAGILCTYTLPETRMLVSINPLPRNLDTITHEENAFPTMFSNLPNTKLFFGTGIYFVACKRFQFGLV